MTEQSNGTVFIDNIRPSDTASNTKNRWVFIELSPSKLYPIVNSATISSWKRACKHGHVNIVYI